MQGATWWTVLGTHSQSNHTRCRYYNLHGVVLSRGARSWTPKKMMVV